MVKRTSIAVAIALLAAGLATAAPPKVVTAPNSDPQCFAPWASDTKLFQYPAKKGPYRIALANGYIANTWRIQMIKTAKAYAAQPDVAAKLKEFKVVSTGEDVAAQIAAINNFIDSGYDAIVVNAQNPAAFKPVIKRANDAGRRAGRIRQHPRHRRGDQRQRRPEGPRQVLGRMAREERAERRQGARGARRVRHVGRSRPARRHPGSVQGVGQEVGHGRGDRQVGRPDGAEGDGRRDRRAQEIRRDHRARRRHRRRAGDDRRQASVRALRRRDRERLPQVLRQVRRARA